jgi:hypothetical protein
MNDYGFDLIDAPEGDAYDLLDFEQRDEVDALADDAARAVIFGVPARPGTRR